VRVIGIDAATIIPGKGGAGGGIWTYTKNILLALDLLVQNEPDIRLKVFVNKNFDLDLKHIAVVHTGLNTGTLLNRLKYIHFVLPSLCKKHNLDVLHKLTAEVPFFYRGDMAVTIHDFMNDFYLENRYYRNNAFQLLKLCYLKHAEKLAVKKSKLIFANSLSIKNELIRRYGDKNVQVIGLGNSVNEIPLPRKNKKAIRFYCVAGYYPHKGHFSVIELVELLVSKYTLDIILYFRGNPGDIKYFNSILDRVRQSSCRERIVMEDYINQHSIAEIYSKASIMILLSEYEGFGLPIIEAQAIGLPVICSDIPVLREVSGGYACFVGLNDTEKAAGIVYDYLRNEEILKWNIINGISNVKRFQWSKNAAQLLQAYQSIWKR
jgi:glycosyltransferase involved in cell wall biosynthesis